MSTPEGRVLKACMDYLKANGIFHFRCNVQGVPIAGQPGRFRPAPSRGIADIIGIAPRRRPTVADIPSGPDVTFCYEREESTMCCPLAVEVKSAKGRQSPAQVAFSDAWTKAGGVYIVVRSVPELRAKLREAGIEAP